MNENQLDGQVLFGKVVDTIVDAVNLHHLDRSTIGPDTALVKEGLGLDSVDILEVIVAVEHQFGVKIPDAESGRENFRTIGTIVRFIQSYSQNHSGNA